MKTKVLITFLFILFLFIRLTHLGTDMTNTDAPRWHSRSEGFLTALKTKDFRSTYQHYQPGVTLMWLNSFVKQGTFWFQYHILGNPEPKTLGNADWYPVLDGLSKSVLVLTLSFLFIYQMLLLKNLFSDKVALLYGFLVAVEPYLIGIDRWLHLTSLETYFAFTSFLALLVWKKVQLKKYLIISGILFGLSALSKITTLIILPTFLIIFASTYGYHKKKELLHALSIFGISVLLTFFILFPALLVDFMYVFEKISTAAGEAVTDNIRKELLTPYNYYFFYILVLLFKLTPLTLILFILSLFSYQRWAQNNSSKFVLLLLLNYFLVLTISQQKIDRYALVLFPSILLIISLYLGSLELKKQLTVVVLLSIQLILNIYTFFPVFSAYYSPLFGGTRGALSKGLYDNSGEYFAQAAFYLNTKGRDTEVFIPNGFDSFSSYFKGNVTREQTPQSNFVVVSYDLTRTVIDNFQCPFLEKSFGSRDLDVVFVYACK